MSFPFFSASHSFPFVYSSKPSIFQEAQSILLQFLAVNNARPARRFSRSDPLHAFLSSFSVILQYRLTQDYTHLVLLLYSQIFTHTHTQDSLGRSNIVGCRRLENPSDDWLQLIERISPPPPSPIRLPPSQMVEDCCRKLNLPL